MNTHAKILDADIPTRRLRLRTLLFLRWLAIAGQAASVILVRTQFGFDLPTLSCVSIITLSVVLNVMLSVRYSANHLLDNFSAALLLGYDIGQLVLLLYLTGGLTNPFALLILAPVTVSAAALPLRYTLVLEAIAIMAVTLLTFFHLPLPWYAGEPLVLPRLYLASVWSALVISMLFISFYAWRIAFENQRMSEALAATEMVLAREQQLSALDGLAAAAAHELGTPLGTIAIVTKELSRELKDHADLQDDMELLKSQIDRCRTILRTLTQKRGKPDALFDQLTLHQLLEEVAMPFAGSEKKLVISVEPDGDGCGPEPKTWRSPAMIYCLSNFLANAFEYCQSQVHFTARWTAYDVRIIIEDDGPGFHPLLLPKLGEPYVSPRRERTGSQKKTSGSSGMGLGFFISKTLAERSGGQVLSSNRPPPEHGARIVMNWPRQLFETSGRN